MMNVRVVILFVFLAVAVNGGRVYRIVGGSDASEGEFPYQVQVLRPENKGLHICGGTIISKDFILTAAHCLKDPRSPNVVYAGTRELGSVKGQTRVAVNVYIHEEYDNNTEHNDIALLKLSKPLEFNDYVKPISLPTEDTTEGTELVLTGWGETSVPHNGSQILQKSVAKVINSKRCNDTFINDKKVHHYLEETQICAFTNNQVGPCHGDSGGPLVLRNKYIVGIISGGFDGCGFGLPDFYTRVYKYVDWIKEHMNET